MLIMTRLIFHHTSSWLLARWRDMPKKRSGAHGRNGQGHVMCWSQTLRTDLYKSQIRCNTSFYSKNINLSQNMVAFSPVIQPLDCKESQRSTLPPHPLPSACNSMTTSAREWFSESQTPCTCKQNLSRLRRAWHEDTHRLANASVRAVLS